MMNNIKHFRKSLITGAAFAFLLSAGQAMATDATTMLPTTDAVPADSSAPAVTSCLSSTNMLDLTCVLNAMMQSMTPTPPVTTATPPTA